MTEFKPASAETVAVLVKRVLDGTVLTIHAENASYHEYGNDAN
jgi:hypothetical protein